MNVHRLKFLDLKPGSITCLAFNSSADSPYLAVSRSNGSIEIWRHTEGKRDLCYFITFPGSSDVSIDCLKWSGNRLFSAGLTGNINEWKLSFVKPVHSSDAMGSPIWCMDISNDDSTLAVGCENGKICLYDITHGSLELLRPLDTQDCRILSLSWHPSSSLIVTGCSDSTIRIMDTSTKHCSLRITVDKHNREDTLVWAVKYLSNDTIISGTSLGRINVWSGQFGTLKQTFSLHAADVLSLAVNEEEDTFFAAGVDHKIVRFKKVTGGVGTWVQSEDIRPHTHDVKSLAVSRNGILASGGIDTELCVNLIGRFHEVPTSRYSPFTGWSGKFKLAASANMLLFQDSASLKLWKVSPKSDSHAPSTGCSPDKDAMRKPSIETMESDLCLSAGLPACLLEIKAASPKHIISSSISDTGRRIAFSDVDKLWIYDIDVGVVCLGSWPLAAVALAFNGSGSSVVVCLVGGGLRICSITDDNAAHFDKLLVKTKNSRSKKNDLVFRNAQYSPCDSYLIVMDEKYQFYLYDTSSYTVLSTLPSIDRNFPPAVAFNKKELLMFSSTYSELYSYDLRSSMFKSIGHVRQAKSRNKRKNLGMTQGLHVMPSRSNVCFLNDFDTLVFVKCKGRRSREDESGESILGKKRKSEDVKYLSSDVAKGYSDIVYAGVLNCGELVIVEKPWTDVVADLPPTILIDRYGT